MATQIRPSPEPYAFLSVNSASDERNRTETVRQFIPKAARLSSRAASLHFSLVSAVGLVSGEAVEIAIASGASQIAWLQPPSGPREGCDEFHDLDGAFAQALAIAMADHRGTLRAAGPVAAGPVRPRGKGPAVCLGASQNVMSVRYVVDTGDHGAASLGQAVCWEGRPLRSRFDGWLDGEGPD